MFVYYRDQMKPHDKRIRRGNLTLSRALDYALQLETETRGTSLLKPKLNLLTDEPTYPAPPPSHLPGSQTEHFARS